jgi:signal peptidase
MTGALLTAGLALGARLAGLQPLVERSDSMSPAIVAGDLVIIRAVPADSIAVGDIVSFRDSGRNNVLVTHRVVALHQVGDIIGVQSQGDANTAAESWMTPPDAEVGRAIAVWAHLGDPAILLDAPLARVCLAAILVVLLALIVSRRYRRRRTAGGVDWRASG